MVQGIGVALTIPASLALMATATLPETRGGSMGVYSAMRMVGFAIGPLIGGLLYDASGSNMAFVIGTIMILIGVLMVQVWVNEAPQKVGASIKSSAKRGQRLFDRQLLTIGLIGAAFASFIMSVDFSMLSALETQVNDKLNETALGFGVAFSALIVSRLISQIPLGRLSDRVGRKPLIILGLILIAPVTALLGVVVTTLQFTWLRIFQGIASAAIAAPAFALAADLSKAGGEGLQMSIITMGFGLGIAAGPLMAGVLGVWSYELPFLVAGVVSLIGAWVVLRFVPETVGRREPLSAAVSDKTSSATYGHRAD
jgi:MFS family permease